MVENKLYNSLPQKQTWNPEDRIIVETADGTLEWLQREAIQSYEDGTLDLNSDEMTPEVERRLKALEEDLPRILDGTYRPD